MFKNVYGTVVERYMEQQKNSRNRKVLEDTFRNSTKQFQKRNIKKCSGITLEQTLRIFLELL